MQPKQSVPPRMSGPSNQYDFIVNASNKHTNSWLVTASLKTRIAIVSVGALILLLIIWIGIALFTASSNGNIQNFTSLAQEQAELVRISQNPATQATLESTQNFAETTRLSLASDQQTFIAYLGALGAKPSTEILSARRNSQSDAQLAAAKEAGTYDQTYLTIAQAGLNTYAAGLKRTFAATSNSRERQLLNEAYQHAELLITLSQQGS